MTLSYAPPLPRERPRYGSFPAWVHWANALSVVLGWALFAFIALSGDMAFLLIMIPLAPAAGLHFVFVFLPTLNRVLFAERIAPLERLVALAMACAGPTGILLGVVFWP